MLTPGRAKLEELKKFREPPTATDRRLSGQKRDNRAALLFLAPWFAGLLLITAGPVIGSLILGFTDYNLIQPPKFNGLENFTRMVSDARLHRSLRVTFSYVAISVPLQLACALALALLLGRFAWALDSWGGAQ